MNNRQEVLNRFIKHVVSQAKRTLTSKGHNASKKLYNSIKGESKAMPNSIGVYFEMEDYGFFQDKGVSGVKKKYNTKFSYKTKMPPPNKLDKWIVRKGIAPRNSKGQFSGRSVNSVGFKKSIQFLIAKSIFYNGIKPTLFFTKPFESAFKNLPDELIDVYGLDVEELFNSIMKQNFKK